MCTSASTAYKLVFSIYSTSTFQNSRGSKSSPGGGKALPSTPLTAPLIYVDDLAEAFIKERDKKPLQWVWYIDDVFMIWSHTNGELDTFLQELNTRQEKIKFTEEVETKATFTRMSAYRVEPSPREKHLGSEWDEAFTR